MKKIAAILLGLSALASAARAEPLSDATRQALLQRGEQVKQWAPLCHGHLTWSTDCQTGDMDLFAGELCLSGETERCDDVRRSQAPDGRWVRSPEHLANYANETEGFSRDASMGVLAYLTATKDVEAAKRWMGWIEAHKITPDLSGYFSVATMCTPDNDSACYIYLDGWGLFGRVWRYLGLGRNAAMERFLQSDTDEGLLDAMSKDPLFPKDQAGRHLYALNVWIRATIAGGHTSATRAMAERLKAADPNNAFFRYLAYGPTEEVAQLLLTQLPAGAPQNPWVWAWSAEVNDPLIHTSTMGWDQVMLLHLLLDR